MALDGEALNYINRWRQAGRAPITERIILQVSNEQPLPGEMITIKWQGNGQSVSLLVNGTKILNNQPCIGTYIYSLPAQSLDAVEVIALSGRANSRCIISPTITKPRIDTFSLATEEVYINEAIRIEYNTTNAVEVNITLIGDSETVFNCDSPSGGIQLRPLQAGSYQAILTAISEHIDFSSEARVQHEIRFTVEHAPILADFSAIESTVELFKTIDLNWQTHNADNVRLIGVGINEAVDSSGIKKIAFESLGLHEFKLIANGAVEQVIETIEVNCVAPSVEMKLSASSEKIDFAETIDLEWHVQGAKQVELTSLNLEDVFQQTEGKLTLELHDTVNFTLKAIAMDDKVYEKQLRIEVELFPKPLNIDEELDCFSSF